MTPTCNQCKQTFEQDAMVQFGDDWICNQCKPAFVQKLKEGVVPDNEPVRRIPNIIDRATKVILRGYGVVYVLIGLLNVPGFLSMLGGNGLVAALSSGALMSTFLIFGIGLYRRNRFMRFLMIGATMVLIHQCRKQYLWRGWLDWREMFVFAFLIIPPTILIFFPEKRSTPDDNLDPQTILKLNRRRKIMVNALAILGFGIVATAATYIIDMGCSCGPARGFPFSYVHPFTGCSAGRYVIPSYSSDTYAPVFDYAAAASDIALWAIPPLFVYGLLLVKDRRKNAIATAEETNPDPTEKPQ